LLIKNHEKRKKTKEFINTGKRVVEREARALDLLEKSIEESFSKAVEIILAAKGRVIVSGMGKSGHIARKVSATLASTGTPSHFLHPGEASHGDLGMITSGDVVILFSNSGETPELANVISYVHRFKIPLIGVAGNASSSLLKNANVPITLPNAKEACNSDIVPTTSTTMTLALGDALAITLMEQREFTPERFRTLHPGGNLGAKLITVEKIMHIGNEIPTVKCGTDMVSVFLEMSTKGFGTVAIINNNGALVGVITDGDLRRNIKNLMSKTCDKIMTKNPISIKKETLASSALALMNENKISSVFVIGKENKLLGILHIHDCIRLGIS
jgi:arabinose-5-phosphate isomerase